MIAAAIDGWAQESEQWRDEREEVCAMAEELLDAKIGAMTEELLDAQALRKMWL